MSKYKVGDVVYAPVGYFDKKEGYFKSQIRRFVIVKIDETDDIDSEENITVSLTGQVHQANKHKGIIVKANSKEGAQMALDKDTFIYCDATHNFSDAEIIRRIGFCPILSDIIALIW